MTEPSKMSDLEFVARRGIVNAAVDAYVPNSWGFFGRIPLLIALPAITFALVLFPSRLTLLVGCLYVMSYIHLRIYPPPPPGKLHSRRERIELAKERTFIDPDLNGLFDPTEPPPISNNPDAGPRFGRN